MPYDQFLRWQLAGDELQPDNPLAISATGFIVAGPHTVLDVPMEEEKIRNRFNELDDMIATTGSAMLGLTLGCARCHDHKYDAIPTRDYYRLQAFFAGVKRTTRELNIKPPEPEFVTVAFKTDSAELTRLNSERDELLRFAREALEKEREGQ